MFVSVIVTYPGEVPSSFWTTKSSVSGFKAGSTVPVQLNNFDFIKLCKIVPAAVGFYKAKCLVYNFNVAIPAV